MIYLSISPFNQTNHFQVQPQPIKTVTHANRPIFPHSNNSIPIEKKNIPFRPIPHIKKAVLIPSHSHPNLLQRMPSRWMSLVDLQPGGRGAKRASRLHGARASRRERRGRWGPQEGGPCQRRPCRRPGKGEKQTLSTIVNVWEKKYPNPSSTNLCWHHILTESSVVRLRENFCTSGKIWWLRQISIWIWENYQDTLSCIFFINLFSLNFLSPLVSF